ncbi:hypothetical protein C8F01DRAFT_1124485 [Mycena amicta]|nr:hypothetical protein C8F01DRAFT_1124485 [Mycena amicta]
MVDQCIHKARVRHTKQLCKIGRASNYSSPNKVIFRSSKLTHLYKVQPIISHNSKCLCRGKYVGLINRLLSDHNTLDTSSASDTALNTCGHANHVSQTYVDIRVLTILILLPSHFTTALLDDLIEYAAGNGDIIDIVEEGSSVCPLDMLGRCSRLHGLNQLDSRKSALG